VSVASYRRSITLKAPADTTLALIREDEYGRIFWEGPDCIGPATCISYVDENEYVVAVDLPVGHSSKLVFFAGCDGGEVSICLLNGGTASREVSVNVGDARKAYCFVLPELNFVDYLYSEWGHNCNTTSDPESYLRIPLDQETVLHASIGGDPRSYAQMFTGWSGACLRALWNERCVIPAGLTDVNVTAIFGPARILKNRTFLFQDYLSGDLVSGGTFTWEGNGYSSSKRATIPSDGRYKFSSIMGGSVTFQLTGVNVGTMWQYTGDAYAELNPGTLASQLWLGSASVREIPVKVVMDSGRPVPGARVSYESFEPCTQNVARDSDYGVAAYSWTLKPEFCKPTALTNERGDVVLSVPFSDESGHLRAVITYGDMQLVIDSLTRDGDGVYRAIVADMPYIDLESSTAEYSFGAPVTVSAVVRDREGEPLPGAIVTLGGISKMDSACALPVAKVSNSEGRVSFNVCPTKNSVLTVSSAAGVEAKLKVKVRTRPSEVRSIVITAGIRIASLRWKVPAEINAGKITDYVIQYRLEGQTAWRLLVDGVSSSTSASVKGLSSGKRYEFRIAAKNKAGLGAWSPVIVIRIR
jgi:hypothetical protein